MSIWLTLCHTLDSGLNQQRQMLFKSNHVALEKELKHIAVLHAAGDAVDLLTVEITPTFQLSTHVLTPISVEHAISS